MKNILKTKKMDKKEALNRLTSLENEAKELRKIIEKPDNGLVSSFEEALEMLPSCDEDVIKYNKLLQAGICGPELALRKLIIVVKVIRGDWKPDWNNSNQNKYYPWFDMRNGVSFVSVRYYWIHASSTVGSLLCVDTRDKAEHLGRCFIDLYRIILNGK